MIALFDGISDLLESRRWVIELTCNLNLQLGMPRNGVIINRDAAIGREELAVFGQHQRIDFQRTRLDAARCVEQFSDRLIQLLRIIR